ncbi:DNA-binding transcriptional LysR family regulator [Streptomyces afghaniensis]|nr:DNA-binding transcriptional LysR family regulator [Streptomyces afghaniensis]
MHCDLQLTRLRTLVAVVDCGGFRRAAAALHISQPAVSQQIRHLESFIQAPVFMSTGRNLQLSVQGDELLGYARRMVALNDEVVRRFRTRTGAMRLSIGMVDQLSDALPEFLRLLSTRLPEIQVSVRTGPSELLANQVTTGQLDVALVFRGQSRHAAPTDEELGRMRMAWFGRPVNSEAAPLPLMLFTEPCVLRNQLVDALDLSSIPWRVSYEGADLIGLRAAGQGRAGACLPSGQRRRVVGAAPCGYAHAALPARPHPGDHDGVRGRGDLECANDHEGGVPRGAPRLSPSRERPGAKAGAPGRERGLKLVGVADRTPCTEVRQTSG